MVRNFLSTQWGRRGCFNRDEDRRPSRSKTMICKSLLVFTLAFNFAKRAKSCPGFRPCYIEPRRARSSMDEFNEVHRSTDKSFKVDRAGRELVGLGLDPLSVSFRTTPAQRFPAPLRPNRHTESCLSCPDPD
jgi:hypothetical protein